MQFLVQFSPALKRQICDGLGKTGIADATIRRELNPVRAMFNLAVKSKSFRQTKLLISLWQKILSQQVSTVKRARVN
jgi:hypothetical protein